MGSDVVLMMISRRGGSRLLAVGMMMGWWVVGSVAELVLVGCGMTIYGCMGCIAKKPKPKLKPIELKTPPEQAQTITRVLFDIVKEHGPLTIAETWEHVKDVGLRGLTSKRHMKILLRWMRERQKLRLVCNHVDAVIKMDLLGKKDLEAVKTCREMGVERRPNLQMVYQVDPSAALIHWHNPANRRSAAPSSVNLRYTECPDLPVRNA
ncbi:hypothetical protein ACLOJK_001862 [Asimina triloba]